MKIFIKTIFFLIFFTSPAFAWQRFEVVDDFSDAMTIGYLNKSSNSGGGFLIIRCDKNIKFEFDPDADQDGNPILVPGPVGVWIVDLADHTDTILFRTDDGSVQRIKWLLSDHGTFYPEDLQKFLAHIKGKSKLRIKIEGRYQTGVFDITGIDRYISNIKASCKVN